MKVVCDMVEFIVDDVGVEGVGYYGDLICFVVF